eukprot:5214908-Pleurochrysis_carterae.AAC.5
MHVNDFDDDYLPLARINDDMLLCVYTTAANASRLMFYLHPRTTRISTAALTKKSGAQLVSKSSRAK